jgi:hypothetical protein
MDELPESREAAERVRQLARSVDRQLSDVQRRAVISWLEELQRIAGSALPDRKKASLALQSLQKNEAVRLIIKGSVSARRFGWTDRSWAARLGLVGAVGITAVAGPKMAGLAALGSATAVPLFVVGAAGGTLIGAFIDELKRSLPEGRDTQCAGMTPGPGKPIAAPAAQQVESHETRPVIE